MQSFTLCVHASVPDEQEICLLQWLQIGKWSSKQYKLYYTFYILQIKRIKVVIILKAMAFLNLSTKNSNRGREWSQKI